MLILDKTTSKSEYTSQSVIERSTVKRPKDNLKPEGRFDVPDRPRYESVERPKPIMRADNLKIEGDLEFIDSKNRNLKVIKGERAEIIKHESNLKMTGEFYGKC